MLTETRPDHGVPHEGSYAAFVRVSTDAQDVANQEHGIKAVLNGGDHKVKWFREEGVSSGMDWHRREVLHKCLDHCRKTGATMLIYTLDRMSRRLWETLRFLEQEIDNGKIKLVVVDDPHMDETTITLRAAVAQIERKRIKTRTKQALGRIKDEIAEKGQYTTREGRVITKLGDHGKIAEAGIKGNERNAELADGRAEQIWPIIKMFRDEGLSYRKIAERLTVMKQATPTSMRTPDISRQTKWHASSVRNYFLRMNQGLTTAVN